MVNNIGPLWCSGPRLIPLWCSVRVVDGMPRAGSHYKEHLNFRNISRAGQNRVAGRTWPAGRVLHVVELDMGVRMGGKNINNVRYADDTTLLGEIKEELLQLVTSVKAKSAQAGLYLNLTNPR